jgi:hypothetical protein
VAEGFCQSGERSSTHHKGATRYDAVRVEGALLTQQILNSLPGNVNARFFVAKTAGSQRGKSASGVFSENALIC